MSETQEDKWPFDDWVRAAAKMGLSPADFWTLSLTDWRALTGRATTPLTRRAFDELCQEYPDKNPLSPRGRELG